MISRRNWQPSRARDHRRRPAGKMTLAQDTRLAGPYRARACGSRWRCFDRCVLEISVGQPYHECDKLAAAVEWVNAHAGDPFASCVVLVGDSLQRHTIGFLERLSADSAH